MADKNLFHWNDTIQYLTNKGKQMEKVNINRASKEELQSIKGIGPVFAERIIQYRIEKGDFKDIYEFSFVKLIGPKRMENFIGQIKV